MIVLAGLPDEPPLARVATALDDLGIAFRMIDQRRHADLHLAFDPAGAQGVLQGKLRCAGQDDIALE